MANDDFSRFSFRVAGIIMDACHAVDEDCFRFGERDVMFPPVCATLPRV